MPFSTSRLRIAEIMHARKSESKAGHVFNWLLIVIILLNVAAVMVGTIESFHQRYTTELYYFEVFSVVIFTIEYLLRVWSVVEVKTIEGPAWKRRFHYLISPMAIIDLIAILPFYLSLFFSFDLRILRIVRLIRVAKLGRHSPAMQMLFDVFKQEYKVLSAALMLLIVLMVIASSGIYLIEHDVQPQHFGSIPQAMWWAMATLTTVGYGDVTPITPLGRFFGGTITVISMAMVALPAGILASSFSDQLRRRREKFRAKVKAALADGALDHNEIAELESLREALDLDKEDAMQLFNIINSQRAAHLVKDCPHCKKPIK